MDGAGNDFVVVDNRWMRFSDVELAGLARRYSPRRTGVGADGLLALDWPETDGAHFRMRYRNADGSLGTMCGNGARCLARFAHRAGIEGRPEGDGVRLEFDSDAGRYSVWVAERSEENVTLFIPEARGFAAVTLADVDEPRQVCSIWTGTEHAVLFVDDVAAEDVAGLGGRIRHDGALAPVGANVDFVEVVDRGDAGRPARVRARTFEKGVEEETLACGTGAVASALAARLDGRLDADRVAVEMPGGTLTVGFELDGPRAEDARGISLEGPATIVFEGTLQVEQDLLHLPRAGP
jgi:diaminopimelate epimerase